MEMKPAKVSLRAKVCERKSGEWACTICGDEKGAGAQLIRGRIVWGWT
jgi:hypothetical protein